METRLEAAPGSLGHALTFGWFTFAFLGLSLLFVYEFRLLRWHFRTRREARRALSLLLTG